MRTSGIKQEISLGIGAGLILFSLHYRSYSCHMVAALQNMVRPTCEHNESKYSDENPSANQKLLFLLLYQPVCSY